MPRKASLDELRAAAAAPAPVTERVSKLGLPDWGRYVCEDDIYEYVIDGHGRYFRRLIDTIYHPWEACNGTQSDAR